MVAVEQPDHGQLSIPRLVDGDTDGHIGAHLPQAATGIHMGDAGRLMDDLGFGHRIGVAVADALDVLGQAHHAMGVVAGQVGTHQRAGHQIGGLR